ncbi:uncharacterized protein PgNI_03888, partial [Pyricularia grisea]|uniref:Uncharacterized protein n=1 Tax=Pyricularia grisea TaxID=148305 RepID=A0A6P8BBE2_PYRGI
EDFLPVFLALLLAASSSYLTFNYKVPTYPTTPAAASPRVNQSAVRRVPWLHTYLTLADRYTYSSSPPLSCLLFQTNVASLF